MSRSSRYSGQPSHCAVVMELWLGPNPSGSCFNSREELVEAWRANRGEVMAQWGSNGRRPAGFYEFEWEGARPPYAIERSTLYERGLLGIDETAQLEAEWRHGFDQAQKLSTDAERERQYREIDLPASLRRRWSAAARRRRVREQKNVNEINETTG
jgi:hypothetical protein